IYVGLCLVLDVVGARRRLAALGAAGAHCARAIRGVVAQLTCAAIGAAATAVRIGFVPVLDVVVTRGLGAEAPATDAVGTIGGQRAALAGFTLGAATTPAIDVRLGAVPDVVGAARGDAETVPAMAARA